METTGSKLTNLSDTDLVALALEQNQAAFIILYTRYNTGVRNHISRYVSQKEDIVYYSYIIYNDTLYLLNLIKYTFVAVA